LTAPPHFADARDLSLAHIDQESFAHVHSLSGTMSVDDVLGAVRGPGYPVQLLDESHDATDT